MRGTLKPASRRHIKSLQKIESGGDSKIALHTKLFFCRSVSGSLSACLEEEGKRSGATRTRSLCLHNALSSRRNAARQWLNPHQGRPTSNHCQVTKPNEFSELLEEQTDDTMANSQQ